MSKDKSAKLMVGEASVAMPRVDSKSFCVAADAKDVEGARVTQQLRDKNPNVMFVIARSCNLNVVVYEAQVDAKHPTRLNKENPIDIYWLNLDPQLTTAARKKGVPHDRDELSWVERKLAYGAKPKPSTSLAGSYHLRMNALTTLPIKMGIDPATNRPKAYLYLDPTNAKPPGTKEGGTLCFLERIYVNVIWKHGLPDVDWLVYYGTTAHDRKPIQQKVVRSL